VTTPRTVDDIITDVTRAPTEADALAALDGVPRATLLEVADQLYLDHERASAAVRRAIVAEARA